MMSTITAMKWLFVLLSIFYSCTSSLFAEEPITPTKKYTLSICSVFKNEADYLKEWIEYHLLVGVDHFYLYNNESSDNFTEVLAPYIYEGKVTLTDWPDQPTELPPDAPYRWCVTTQVPAYADACRKRALETKWLALIDTDEFLVPVESNSMKEVVEKRSNAPGITLRWQLYGTSGVQSIPPNKLLIELMHRTCPPGDHHNETIVKSIVKPELFESFTWPPHCCSFQNGQRDTELHKRQARINHYSNRTIDFFYKQKISNKAKSANMKMTPDVIESFLTLGNEVEDPDPVILRFVPELRKRMGFE